ncbi:MAG: hypothetical protein IPP63_13290 [Chloracidobacterium sp.]|nr:hypothetical protein [Chloracidobacterium sp.]
MVLPTEFMQDHIVCIASEFKGNEFLEEAHKAGWYVTSDTEQLPIRLYGPVFTRGHD